MDPTELGALASRYISVSNLPWKPTGHPGVEMKVLLEDKESGLLTALFRWQPGAVLPLHEHVEIEQTYMLEGSIIDDEGEVKKGDFVWRPGEPARGALAERRARARLLPETQSLPRVGRLHFSSSPSGFACTAGGRPLDCPSPGFDSN